VHAVDFYDYSLVVFLAVLANWSRLMAPMAYQTYVVKDYIEKPSKFIPSADVDVTVNS
jgi:hypothetical protein